MPLIPGALAPSHRRVDVSKLLEVQGTGRWPPAERRWWPPTYAVLVILLPLPLSAVLSCSSLSSAADCRRNGKLLPTPGLFFKNKENTTETKTSTQEHVVFVVFKAAFFMRREAPEHIDKCVIHTHPRVLRLCVFRCEV
jgi:hypothetical protein